MSFEMVYAGLDNGKHALQFPRMMYKDGADPLLVHNTLEMENAIALGYDSITSGAMANRYLTNWYWDLEDMSPRQLVVFAQDEFDVDLPIEAGQTKLLEAVLELTKNSPQNRNRIVLMAHTLEMNYTASQDEIQRMMSGGRGLETETITQEVFL